LPSSPRRSWLLEEDKAGAVSLNDHHRTGNHLIMPSHLSVLAAIGGLLTFGHAQNSSTASASSTSTYSQPNVPTGVPIPGDYDEPLRPQVHFSPPTAFMNDPNGMYVDSEGVYHLYYQYNPTANIAGSKSSIELRVQRHLLTHSRPALGPRNQQGPLHMDQPAHRHLSRRSNRGRFLRISCHRSQQH
jgi:hypothetical protein